jgi:rubrerythrin
MEGARKVVGGLTLVEVLGVAIRSEMDAQAFYQKLARRVKNPVVKQKFLGLAWDEAGHEAMLRKKYCEVAGKGKPALPVKVEGRARYNSGMSHAEALKLAIRLERAASNLYAKAAKKTADISSRFMLEYLSGFERNHERLLVHELDAVTKYPAWFESESGADIMLIGP